MSGEINLNIFLHWVWVYITTAKRTRKFRLDFNLLGPKLYQQTYTSLFEYYVICHMSSLDKQNFPACQCSRIWTTYNFTDCWWIENQILFFIGFTNKYVPHLHSTTIFKLKTIAKLNRIFLKDHNMISKVTTKKNYVMWILHWVKNSNTVLNLVQKLLHNR